VTSLPAALAIAAASAADDGLMASIVEDPEDLVLG
jgi:hypothetical protein